MTPAPKVLHAKDTVAAAIELMSKGHYRHLPSVDDQGTPVAVTAVGGIVHYLVEHFPQTIYNLPPEPRLVAQEREGA